MSAPGPRGMPRSFGVPTTPPSDAGSPQTTTAAAVRGRAQEKRRVAQRQSSELQRDQSKRSRQGGCAGRSSTFARGDLASVPCTSRLSTVRLRSRASEARGVEKNDVVSCQFPNFRPRRYCWRRRLNAALFICFKFFTHPAWNPRRAVLYRLNGARNQPHAKRQTVI